ncbi:hypothetical protein LCGC14_1144840 [marine sediment metagenome]|uniref:Uncharacterized protein n=1 Tax=marine sediment metagenome TaxID=412755 RepID=A0A0F9MKC1_9ZZZZ
MRDWLAERLYLAHKRKGWGYWSIRGCWQIQQWLTVPPILLIKLLNRNLLIRLIRRGSSVWSTKMFDDQLRRGGLL